MRRAARADANQPAVVAALRLDGWFVLPIHTLGRGCPDLLVSKRLGGNPWCALVEIKDGAKPPSARKLTPDEQKFAEAYTGPLVVALSGADAIAKLKETWQWMELD